MDEFNKLRYKNRERMGIATPRSLRQKVIPRKDQLSVGFNYYVKFYSRRDWKAVAPKQSTGYLCKPATHIRLTTTRTDYCNNNAECIKTLQQMQTHYMNSGLPDIPYNFMIGGDTAVYEGRGFLWDPLLKEEYGEHNGRILDVALVGTFENEEPLYPCMRVALDLINALILKKILIFKFELISFPECRQPKLTLI